MESLARLVRLGDVDGLRHALSSMEDARQSVNETDDRGYTPLYNAVSTSKPNIEIVRVLLDAGADPNFVKVETFPESSFDLEDIPDDILGIDKEMLSSFIDHGPTEHREPLLEAALRGTNVEIVQLLHEYGANLDYHDEHNYTAVLDAVYGEGGVPMVRYLIGLGLSVQEVSSYGESALTVAYHNGRFEIVSELLEAGADDSLLKASPLHRAVAIGTVEDVRQELQRGSRFEVFDVAGHSPLHTGLRRGNGEIVALLRDTGADLKQRTSDDTGSLVLAVEGGNFELVAQALQAGYSSEDLETALHIAVEQGKHRIAQQLLEFGADPNMKGGHNALISGAYDREMILLLHAHGASLSDLDNEGRRRLLGLKDDNEGGLDGVSKATYLIHRYPVEGAANPENIGDPFRLAMIRCGWNAYWARKHFDDPATFVCGINGQRPPPVWCFDRLGQSTTLLPDGRIVLVAGEHEDGYDPNFCIYNDVTVFDSDGTITLYGYPSSVFPPTDFHSATLVEDWIYIIGSIGYQGKRNSGVPVYRLSTKEFHIEHVPTTGQDPGRIHRHRAELLGEGTIKISGGTLIRFEGSEEITEPNPGVYLLDLRTRIWTKA